MDKVGTRISVRGVNGVIRYVGPHKEKEGDWIGIELDVPKGRNNGTIGGHTYFECNEKHGIFLSMEDAKKHVKIESVAVDVTPTLTGGISQADLEKAKSELEQVLKSCKITQEKLDLLKRKDEEMNTEYASISKIYQEELETRKAEHDQKILELTFRSETGLLELEQELLDFKAQERQYTEGLSGESDSINLLQKLDDEHVWYQYNFNKLMEMQRIRRNTMKLTIQTLQERLAKIDAHTEKKQDEAVELKRELNSLESELNVKRPQWEVVETLREERKQLSERIASVSLSLEEKASESLMMDQLYGLCDPPFLDCIIAVQRIRAKIDIAECDESSKYNVLHFCDLFDFVFSTNFDVYADSRNLLMEIQRLESGIEAGNPPQHLDSLIKRLEQVSGINLAHALTKNWLNMALKKTRNTIFEEISSALPRTIHPLLLKNEGDAFITLLDELKTAVETNQDYDFGMFLDTIPVFVNDLTPEVDLLQGYSSIIKRAYEARQEHKNEVTRLTKTDLQDQLEALTEEFNSEKASYMEARKLKESLSVL